MKKWMFLAYDLVKIKFTQKRSGIENTSDCCMRNSNLDNQIWKILLFGLYLNDAYVYAWFPINGGNIRHFDRFEMKLIWSLDLIE